MPRRLSPFLHRANTDNTFDSICIRCFRTITTGISECQLAEAETEHQCAPSALAARVKSQVERATQDRAPDQDLRTG